MNVLYAHRDSRGKLTDSETEGRNVYKDREGGGGRDDGGLRTVKYLL